MEHFEQVPLHSVTQLDDGVQEKLQIVVRLPGVASVAEFTVRVQASSLKLHAPGRYFLDLSLDAVVDEKPEQLKFVKKRNEFKAVLKVICPLSPRQHPQSSAAESIPKGPSQKPGVHESFLADAAKLMGTQRRKKVVSKQRLKKAKQEAAALLDDSGGDDYIAWERPKRRGKKQSTGFSGAADPEEGVDGEPAEYFEEGQPPEFLDGLQSTPAAELDAKDADLDLSGPETPPSESVSARASRRTSETPTGESEPQFEIPFSGTSIEEELRQTIERSKAAAGNSSAPSAEMPSSDDQESKYNEGQRRANQEAGEEAMERALEAMQAGEHERAFRLFRKAAWLSPSEDPRLEQMMEFCELFLRHKDEDRQPGNESSADPTPSPKEPHPASGEQDEETDRTERRSPPPASFEPELKSSAPPSAHQRKSKKPQQPKPNPKEPKSRRTNPAKQEKQEADEAEQVNQEAEKRSAPEQGSREWFQEFQKEAAGKGFTEKLLMWILLVAALAVFLVLKCLRTPLRFAYSRAPRFLLDTVAFFRWQRLHRFLSAHMRKSVALRVALSCVSCVLALMATYWVFNMGLLLLYFSWATFEMSLEATFYILGATFRSSLALLSLVFWRPRFWTSALLAVCMRYGSLLFGRRQTVFYISCFWGWPLMMEKMGGGFLGLLTLPFCFVSTAWNVSHLHLICAYSFVSLAFNRLGWSYGGVSGLVLGAIYLFIVALPTGKDDKGRKATTKSYEVPEGAEGVVARVLTADDLYEVLMVPRDADAEVLRKAKRVMSLATHPDKLGQAAGSNEAFARVTEAHEILSDPAKREAYDKELRVRAYLEEMQFQADSAGSSSRASEAAEGITFMCPSCGLDHSGKFVDRPAEKARYCSDCDTYHPAKDGDGWHESSFGLFGSKVKMFVCLNGKVLDMTQWADCALKLSKVGSQIPVNTHKATYAFGSTDAAEGGAPHSGGSTKKKAKKGRRR